MREVLPGVLWWTATHPRIGIEVSSHWVPGSRALIDPLLPPAGLDAFREHPPERILLSNRHHLRDSEAIAAEYGCSIHCSEPGLHEFADGPEVSGFAFGDQVAPGIQALEVGAICPDETALLIREARALLVADGIMRYGEELSFVPDQYIGERPAEVKRALRESYSRLLELDYDFDNLLFAHGNPLIGGGADALAAFCMR
jgi:glyoxylase-like metal-dependent hydrolase (beta-lactamase superfamily II)